MIAEETESHSSNYEQEQQLSTHIEVTSDSPLMRHEGNTILIDQKILPFIFRFNYEALKRLRLSTSMSVPQIAFPIFHFIIDRHVLTRSQGGRTRFCNRMKLEEKVKYLLRAFEQRHSLKTGTQPRRLVSFGKQGQKQFFSREEVQKRFLQEIFQALVRKKYQNQKRVKQMQNVIQATIDMGFTQPQMAEKIFEEMIKRKQLPWTDHMFMDLMDYARYLYLKHVPMIEERRRMILNLDVGTDGRWDMTESVGYRPISEEELQDENRIWKFN